MIVGLKEEMKKCLKDIQEVTNKEWNGRDKTVQNLKVETESIKETQTEENLQIKTLKFGTGTTEPSHTNR